MSTTDKAQYWGYTLNNATLAELVLVREPPAGVGIVDHVYTPEQGASGTHHIQGWFKMSSQVRKSHLIRHWLPNASFRPLQAKDYQANMRAYVQKQDETARGATRQTVQTTPIVYPAIIPEMIIRWIRNNTDEYMGDHGPHSTEGWRRWIRDTQHIDERFDAWLERNRRHYKDISYTNTPWGEVQYAWKGHEFMPSHEAPTELLLDYARSQMVRRHRVETLVDRPEVRRATDRYAEEILSRIEHNHADDPQEEATEEEGPRQEEVREEGTHPAECPRDGIVLRELDHPDPEHQHDVPPDTTQTG